MNAYTHTDELLVSCEAQVGPETRLVSAASEPMRDSESSHWNGVGVPIQVV